MGSGSTFSAITTKHLNEFPIILPPLAEQKRIAAILDEADALRRKRREAIAKLDIFLQSVFLDMFGDPVTNPKGWERVPLADMCTIDAPLVDPTLPQYRNLLHFGPDRIARDTGELLAAQTASQDGQISSKYLFTKSHILYSKIRPYLNKVALAATTGLCSADMYPISINNKVARIYLWRLLLSKDFLDHTENYSNRANIPKINREQFMAYRAPLPPFELQEEFASRVEAINVMRAQADTSLAQTETLFTTLQHQAFHTEFSTDYPADLSTLSTGIPAEKLPTPCLILDF